MLKKVTHINPHIENKIKAKKRPLPSVFIFESTRLSKLRKPKLKQINKIVLKNFIVNDKKI